MTSTPEMDQRFTIEPAGVETTEHVLGMSLLPERVESYPLDLAEQQDRLDIRKYARYAVAHVLREVDGGSTVTQNGEDCRHIVEGSVLLQTMVRQLCIANNMLSAPVEADQGTDPRSLLQSTACRTLVKHTQTVPTSWVEDLTSHGKLLENDKFALIAPTGVGKTHIEATFLRNAGIGQGKNPNLSRPLRALGILPDTNLSEQFTGQIGKDAFMRTLGQDVSVTLVSGKSKDATGDVVLATKQILPSAIESGLIRPDLFDIAFMDEGHHGLEPEMLKLLGALGTRLYFFTATPKISERRDLRKLAPHVELESTRGCVEAGILNAVRLFTFRSGTGEHDNPTGMAARLAWQWVQEGRKVVVYAQPGDRSRQAETVANLINTMSGSQVAGTVTGFLQNNSDTQHRFNDGRLRCITTVGMLREGWDAPVDTGISVGATYSLWMLAQKTGRILRLGTQESIMAEILPPVSEMQGKRPLATIWMVMGLERIQQGQLIAPTEAEGRKRDGEASGNTRPRPGLAISSLLPADLAKNLVEDQPLRSILVAPGERAKMEPPPPGSASSASLARQYNVPVEWLQKYVLDANDFPYQGVWSREEEEWDYERWYTAEAVEYLATHPMERLAADGELLETELVELFEVPAEEMRQILGRLKEAGSITPHVRLTQKGNRKRPHYTPEGIQAIKQEVEKIPVAEEDDVVVAELGDELGMNFVYYQSRKLKLSRVNKRRHPATGIRGYAEHISSEAAQLIRNAETSVAVATADDIGYTEIAQIAGVSLAKAMDAVKSAFTEEEMDVLLQSKRPYDRARPQDFMPRARGLAIAEKIKVRKLPPYLITLPLMAAHVGKTTNTVRAALRRNEIEPYCEMNLGGPGHGSVACYLWTALQTVEGNWPPNVDPIDYDRIAQDPGFVPEEAWRYSQSIQRRYVVPDILMPALEEHWVGATETMRTLNCTPAALSMLITVLRIEDHQLRRSEQGLTGVGRSFIEKTENEEFGKAGQGSVSYTTLMQFAHGDRRIVSQALNQVPNIKASARLKRGGPTGLLDVYFPPSCRSALSASIQQVVATMKQRP